MTFFVFLNKLNYSQCLLINLLLIRSLILHTALASVKTALSCRSHVHGVINGRLELQKCWTCVKEWKKRRQRAACPLWLKHGDDYVTSVIHMSGCVTVRKKQDVKHGCSHQRHAASLINTPFSQATLIPALTTSLVTSRHNIHPWWGRWRWCCVLISLCFLHDAPRDENKIHSNKTTIKR